MHLTEWCHIPTSGAYGVEPFEPDGTSFLAASHVAIYVSCRSADIDGGDRDVDLSLRRWGAERNQLLHTPRALSRKDAEFSSIGGCAFRWRDDSLGAVEEFATSDGADAAVAPDGGQSRLTRTSHALSVDDWSTAHCVMCRSSECAE